MLIRDSIPRELDAEEEDGSNIEDPYWIWTTRILMALPFSVTLRAKNSKLVTFTNSSKLASSSNSSKLAGSIKLSFVLETFCFEILFVSVNI